MSRAVRSFQRLVSESKPQPIEGSEPTINERENRRPVAFTGFGALDDGTTFQVSVVDLSYNGCKVATDLALFPGVGLHLAINGFAGSVAGKVAWCKDGCVGISFQLDNDQTRRVTARAHERSAVDAQASIRRVGRKAYRARLFDLTPAGCKVEFIERPKAGELVWVKFDGLDGMEAYVRWVDGFHGGLQFVRPLHLAIFESVLAKLRH